MGCCASAEEDTTPPAAPAPAPAPVPAPAGGDAYVYNPKSSAPTPPAAPVSAPTYSDPHPPPEPAAPAAGPAPDLPPPPPEPAVTSNAKLPRAGAAPTGGAYRGWAPPTKEHFSETASKGQKKRVTVEDQWDEDGNLTRVTTTKTFAPDWKTTTQTEFIPAAKAAEMGIERKTAWNS